MRSLDQGGLPFAKATCPSAGICSCLDPYGACLVRIYRSVLSHLMPIHAVLDLCAAFPFRVRLQCFRSLCPRPRWSTPGRVVFTYQQHIIVLNSILRTQDQADADYLFGNIPRCDTHIVGLGMLTM